MGLSLSPRSSEPSRPVGAAQVRPAAMSSALGPISQFRGSAAPARVHDVSCECRAGDCSIVKGAKRYIRGCKLTNQLIVAMLSLHA